jgi:hypothetical protein
MASFFEKQRRGQFLTSFFGPVPGSTGGNANTLVWDIERYTDTIAGTVDPNTGSNLNTLDKFSTKEMELPTYAEAVTIDAADLVNRMIGQNPFDAANSSATSRLMQIMQPALVQMSQKIDRSVEVQAAQVLQTGLLALPGAKPFAADFKPKATHFPSASTVWSDSVNAIPLTDLANLCNVIQTDSRVTMGRAIFGKTALREFLASNQVQEQADLRRIDLIAIDPGLVDRGARRWGAVTFEGYDIEIWSYDAEYTPFGGGANVRYVDDDKVILLPTDTSGNLVVASLVVPRVLPSDPRVTALLSAPTTSAAGWDLSPNMWTNDEGTIVNAGFRARPVLIPVGIDTFGALTT